MYSLGWSVSIDSRRCFFHGCAINYDPLETIEATAFGTYEIDLFGRMCICDWNIAMATAYCRFDGWYFMWHRANDHNGPILKHYNKIWSQSEGLSKNPVFTIDLNKLNIFTKFHCFVFFGLFLYAD